jgi:hypothetical protein
VSDEKPRMLMLGELQDLAASVARNAAPAFAAAGWEWRDGGVPDEAQIAANVMHLIENAAHNMGGSTSSGRFMVSRYIEEGLNVEVCDVELHVGSLPAYGERALSDHPGADATATADASCNPKPALPGDREEERT